MSAEETLYDDPVLRLVRSRNLLLAAWSNAPAVGHAHALGRGLALLAREYLADFGVLNVVVGGTPRFADDFRAALNKIVADPKLQGHGAAHVILLEGLAGVATRAFLSTVFLVGRSVAPNKVFADLPRASAWLAPLMARGREPWSPDDVTRAARAFLEAAPLTTRRP